MKKKIFGYVCIMMLIFLSVFSVNISKNGMKSDLQLENLIAISVAQGEGGDYPCGCCAMISTQYCCAYTNWMWGSTVVAMGIHC